MNNKTKNIVTNFLGLIFYGLSVYAFFLDKEIKYIVGLLVIGSAFFLFKNETLIDIVKKIIPIKINESKSFTVDPDKEEKPDERG